MASSIPLIDRVDLLSSSDREVYLAQKLLDALKRMDFSKIPDGSMLDWTCNFACAAPGDRLTVPLGCHLSQSDEYAIAFERIGEASLNAADESGREIGGVEFLVELTLSAGGQAVSQLAIPVGRLIASCNGRCTVTQSRWVVLLDEERRLWACLADGADVELLKPGYVARYDSELDNAFHADRSNKCRLIELGNIDRFEFSYSQQLSFVEVVRGSWYTTRAHVWNNGDISQPMYPSGFRRLLSVDLSQVRMPKISLKFDFYYVTDIMRYREFRNNLNFVNRPSILDRPTTEAAWLKALLNKFMIWNLDPLTPFFPGREMAEKQRMLIRALMQKSGRNALPNAKIDDVEEYWLGRAALQPGLEIAWLPDDSDEDRFLNLVNRPAKPYSLPSRGAGCKRPIVYSIRDSQRETHRSDSKWASSLLLLRTKIFHDPHFYLPTITTTPSVDYAVYILIR